MHRFYFDKNRPNLIYNMTSTMQNSQEKHWEKIFKIVTVIAILHDC